MNRNLVGTAGFEPTTTTPPVWCATRLRYAPNSAAIVLQMSAGWEYGFVEAIALPPSGLESVQSIFKLGDHLADQLFVLSAFFSLIFTGQALPGTADGETLIVQQ